MCWMALLSVAVSAQDFASRFMAEHQADSNLTCVTISPKMMEEIMKSDAEKDKEVLDMISNLKSMQVLTSDVEGKKYFNAALKVERRIPVGLNRFFLLRTNLRIVRLWFVRKKVRLLNW